MAPLTVANMIDLSVNFSVHPIEMVASKSFNGYTLCYRYLKTNKDSFEVVHTRRGEPRLYKTFEAVWDDVQKIDPGSNLMVINEME